MSKQVYAQASLFHRNGPKKSTISYTSGPNPDLSFFVEKHAIPYEPSQDSYSVGDFSAELKGNRHSAVYNFLGYSSKKPYEPIEKYLQHFTEPGDLVLDTFCGSGGVGFVASKIRRNVVLVDLSPLATMISSAYTTAVDVLEVEKAFEMVETKAAIN